MSANNVHQKGLGEAARLLGGNFDDNDNKSLHDNTYYHSQPPQQTTYSFLIPLPQPKQFVAFLLLNTEFPSYHEEIKWQEDATRIELIARFIHQKQYIDYPEQQKIKITNIQEIMETIEAEWMKESKSEKESYFAECERLYLKAKSERKIVQLQAFQEDRQLQSQGIFIGGEQTIGKYEDFHLFSNNNQLSASPQFNSITENTDKFFPPMSSIQPRPARDYYEDDTLPEDMGPPLF